MFRFKIRKFAPVGAWFQAQPGHNKLKFNKVRIHNILTYNCSLFLIFIYPKGKINKLEPRLFFKWLTVWKETLYISQRQLDTSK